MKYKYIALLLAGVAFVSGCSHECKKPCHQPNCPKMEQRVMDKCATHFAFNSATLTAADKAALNKVVHRLNKNKNEKVTLSGYTDSTGTEAYNLGLGERRAMAVEAYLIEQGISPDRIQTKSFGAKDAIASNTTSEGRAQNRRVDVQFHNDWM